jgi:glycerophosphoryl diester phosphodiesterase
MNYWTQSKQNIFVAAHRGWSAKYPENTMEAFRAAAEAGVDQIETDIRITKDGELVLMHDHTVDRTTNGTGLVREKTLAEIRALDAGSWKGAEFAGYKVPTLKEFMDYIATLPEMTIDFELKEYPVDGREEISYEVCDRVLKMVDDYGFTDRCVINTFNAKLHEYIRERYGNKYRQHVYFPIVHMGEYTVDPYSYGYCCCMFPENEQETYMASLAECEKMRARGVQTWAGAGVHDEEGVKKAIAHGASLITCNNPDEILAILRRLGYHK